MQEIMLDAIERPKKSGRFRESGFVPGVLYGDDIPAGTLVKFEEKALNKILIQHGSSANITIDFNGNKKTGFIKEVQRKPITGNLIHIDVQIVSKEHQVKRQIPIIFTGEEILNSKHLLLNILKSEVTVFGKIALMPDTISIDVSNKKFKDSITYSDFNLDKELKNEDVDVFGTITDLKKAPVDDAETTETEAVAE